MRHTTRDLGRSKGRVLAALACGALVLGACSSGSDDATSTTTAGVTATTEVVAVDAELAEALDIEEGTEIVVVDQEDVAEEPTSTTVPAGVEAAATGLVEEVSADTGIAVDTADDQTFGTVTDSTGAFSFDVPSEWSSLSTDLNGHGGSFLVATAGSLSAFYDGAPGIVVATVPTAAGVTAERQLDDEVAHFQALGKCATRSESRPYADGTFTGTTVTLTDCASGTSQVFIGVTTDEPSPFSTILFHVNVESPSDLSALGRAMSSFTLL